MATMEEDLTKQGFTKEGESFVWRGAPAEKTGQVQKSPLPGVPNTPDSGTKNSPEYTLAGLRTKQMEISAISDPGEQMNALANLHGSVQGWMATKIKSAQALAENETNVAALKQALDESIQLDRNTPSYFQKYGTADSDETAQVRQQYQSALAMANNLTQKYVQADPELNAVSAEFDLFLKNQASVLGKKQAEESKIKEYGAEIQDIASMVTGGTATPDLVMKNISKYATYNDVAKDPALLVSAALEGKDAAYGTILASKQAELTSGTKDRNSLEYQKELVKANRDIQTMRRIITDENSFQTILAGSKLPEQELAKWKLLYKDAGLSEQGRKNLLQAKKDFALKTVRDNAKDEFMNNLDSWVTVNEQGTKTAPFSDPSTPLGKAFANVKGVTGQVSLKSLVAEFKKLPPAERPTAQKALVQAMRGAKDHASSGYFGQFADTLNVETEVYGAVTSSILDANSGVDILGRAVANPMAATLGAGVYGVYKNLSEFLSQAPATEVPTNVSTGQVIRR